MNALISQAKVNTMYRTGPVYVRFYVEDGTIWGQYYEGGAATEARKNMGSANIALSFETSDGAVRSLSAYPDPANDIYIGFERGTGRLRDASDFGAALYTGKCIEISLSNTTTTYLVTVNAMTGKNAVSAA
jgi:hypothetical protein